MAYTDREALLKQIDESKPENWTNSDAEIQAEIDYAYYRGLVSTAPAADVVEVRHGMRDANKEYAQWMRERFPGGYGFLSVSRELWLQIADRIEQSLYCPESWAKTEGDKSYDQM